MGPIRPSSQVEILLLKNQSKDYRRKYISEVIITWHVRLRPPIYRGIRRNRLGNGKMACASRPKKNKFYVDNGCGVNRLLYRQDHDPYNVELWLMGVGCMQSKSIFYCTCCSRVEDGNLEELMSMSYPSRNNQFYQPPLTPARSFQCTYYTQYD